VGGAAARSAAALGAQVTVLGRRQHALRAFAATVAPNVACRILTRAVLEDVIPRSDVVIGAILESTWDTPALIPPALVAEMPTGAVLIDATAGYGPGYLPTFDRQSTATEPVFERHGVLHCKLDSLPKFVPITATYALSAVAAPYLAAMARAALLEDEQDPVSAAGRVVAGGEIVHPVVERHARMNRAHGG
jgi:alanine dehydrogenase